MITKAVNRDLLQYIDILKQILVRKIMKLHFKKILDFFGLVLMKKETLELMKFDLLSVLKYVTSDKLLKQTEKDFIFFATQFFLKNENTMYSQLGQDLLALSGNSTKRNGFFVEIGGGNAIRSSNTYLLQSEFDWQGIIVEPNPELANEILAVRGASKQLTILTCAIAKDSGTENFLAAGLLGTLDRFIAGDAHQKQRKKLRNQFGLIQIETLSSFDFVKKHVGSKKIDFLSVDTEGSEFEILSNWPFNLSKPKIIVFEHNNRKWKFSLEQVLQKNGYIKVLEKISKFDSWFVLIDD